jgi:hypothetical protein
MLARIGASTLELLERAASLRSRAELKLAPASTSARCPPLRGLAAENGTVIAARASSARARTTTSFPRRSTRSQRAASS